MKKLVAVLAMVAVSAGATVAFAASNPGTGVVGSIHDMNVWSGKTTPDKLGRVCAFCHTPHNAEMGGAPAGSYPLWNKTLGSEDTWLTYVWATPLNSTLSQVSGKDPMAGPSRLCMSCHDGVLAPDQHGSAVPAAGGGGLQGPRAIGLLGGDAATKNTYDLTDDHPIGFSWTDAVAARNAATATGKPEIATTALRFAQSIDPAAATADGTYNEPTRFANGRTIGDVLFKGDVMTCASCHEVHNKENVPPSLQNDNVKHNYLLWADENNSLICLSCHVK